MSLVNTVLQNIRTAHHENLDRNESRGSRYGVLDHYINDTRSALSIFSPEIRNKIKNSIDRTIQMPVINFKDVTISNSRSCVIAPDENTSALISLTFATYSFGFQMFPAQYGTNEIGYQLDLEKKILFAMQKLAATLEAAGVAKLEADKNQLWTGIAAYYPQVANALQVEDDEKEDYYNNLQAILETMDFYGDLNILSSTSGSPLMRRLEAQGSANGTNQAFQMTPYNWVFSNRITNAAGVRSTQYVVPDGTLGFDTRIDRDAMMRHSVGGGQKQWYPVSVPIPNSPNMLDMGLYYYEDCADLSGVQDPDTAVASMTRAKMEAYEFSFDATFASAYNSNIATRFNPIVKTEIKTPV